MGQIEIGTSQNVGIRYEAANVMERILATVIDAVIMLGVLIGLYVTVIMIAVNGTFDSSTTEVLGWVFLGIGILDVLYPVLCETFWNGQTIGKRMMRLRVMRVDGTQPRIVDYFLRWLIGLVEIVLTSGAVAAILIMASRNHQRLGDMAAGTTVVRLPKKSILSASFLEVDEGVTSVRYPEVQRLTDKDIAIIRDVLTAATSKAIAQEASVAMLWRTKERVQEVMGITADGRPEEFLMQVIDDYNATFSKS